MRSNRIPKEKLFEVESQLYEEYGTLEAVLDVIEEYSYGYRGCSDFIHEVLDYYSPYNFSATDAMQICNDFKSVGEIEYYNDSLELFNDPTMLWIDADIDEDTYWAIVESYIDSFEEEYDVSGVAFEGRGGKHCVCPNTWENVVRYDHLVEGAEKYQKEFIDYINSNYGM